MRRRTRVVTLAILVAMAALAGAAARAAEMSPDRQSQVLRAALNAFDEAVSLARDKPAQAEELYREAEQGFTLLAESGLRSAGLEYNLGNTYFRLGQLGHAILHFRRAQQLAPRDEKLLANLDYARRQVEPFIEPAGQRRLVRDLLFLHYSTSLRQRFWAAAILSAAGWLLLILRLRWRLRSLFISGVIVALLGLSFAASVGWQMQDETQRPPGVLVGEKMVLRLGRGEGYDAALKQPLGPGVEVRILQRRGDWIEVSLPNDQTGWLPAGAVEPV